jgi:hypothetical protein
MTIHFIILHKKWGPINAYTFLVEYYVETCFALALPRKEKDSPNSSPTRRTKIIKKDRSDFTNDLPAI